MKSIALLAATSAVTLGHASFDMMYIPDTSGLLVHRYDPVNRVYLGSINASARMAAGNSATSRLGLCNVGNLPYFVDGYTGEFLTSTTGASAQSIYMRSSGTELLTSSGSVLRRYDNVTGNLLANVTVGGTMTFAQSITEIGSGRFAVVGDTPNGIAVQTYSSTLGFLSEAVIIGPSSVATASAISSLAFVTLGGASHLVFTYRDNSNQVQMARVIMSGGITPSGTITSFVGGYSTASPTTTTSVMAGHGGTFFIVGLGTTTGVSRVRQSYIAGGLLNTVQDYTTTAFVSPSAGYWSGSNVVAPEPASFLALGAGLVAILRRRVRAKAA